MIRRMLIAVAWLCGMGLAWGQPPESTPPAKPKTSPQPKSDSFDSLLAEALKTNPEVQLAEVKVREAEAMLYKARIQLMQQIVAAKSAVDLARINLEFAVVDLERLTVAVKSGRMTQSELRQAESAVAQTKAALAKAETELQIILGRSPFQFSANSLLSRSIEPKRIDATIPMIRYVDAVQQRYMEAAATISSPATDRLRTTLDSKVKWSTSSATIADAVEELRSLSKNSVTIRLLAKKQADIRIDDLPTGEFSIAHILMMIEDSTPDLAVFVREYGVLITSPDRRPDEGVSLRQYMKNTSHSPSGAASANRPK